MGDGMAINERKPNQLMHSIEARRKQTKEVDLNTLKQKIKTDFYKRNCICKFIQTMNTKKVQSNCEKMAFKSIKLFKTETLGAGSYGAVCKAKCDELICAAKLLYPVLFKIDCNKGNLREHRQPSRRFEAECQFLSLIQHPNIVQYLGTYHDPETNAPVLLMELMDESLTHFLESSPGDIPYHIQVDLASDIAQALAFLHTNEIIHRDLSSNNVLLLAGRAKVADFGMSKFATNLASMTTCPGTAVYMPPEALNTPPVYTEKLDVFSLGVLMIQIMTCEFPKPANRFLTKEVIDPADPETRIQALVVVSEAERRYTQMSMVDHTHQMLPIAQSCLLDSDMKRPSSIQLCRLFTHMKKSSKYNASLAIGKTFSENFRNLKDSLEEKEAKLKEKENELKDTMANLKAANDEIRKLKKQSKRVPLTQSHSLDTDSVCHVDTSPKRKTRHNTSVRAISPILNIIADNEHSHLTSPQPQGLTVSSFFNQKLSPSYSLEQLCPPSNTQALRHSSSMQHLSSSSGPQFSSFPADEQISRKWRTLTDCPINIQAGSSTVVGNKAYFQNRDTGAIVEYDNCTEQWSLIPFQEMKQCGLACVEGNLTTVGGHDDESRASNRLFCLINRKWNEILPPMITKRDCPAAVSTSTALIVAGGRNKFQTPIRTVEVFGIASRQWSVATVLPFPAYRTSAVVHRGYLYMTAGEGGYNHPERSVIKCPLDILLKREHTQNTPIYTSTSLKKFKSYWEEIADLPVQDAQLVEVRGHLLAVGGGNHPRADTSTLQTRGTRAVYEYKAAENTWISAGHMTMSRHHCLATTLPGNRVIVVGGIPARNKHSKSTEYTQQ